MTAPSACEDMMDSIIISTDKAKIDVDYVHAFLVRSYWAGNVPRSIVERSLENSLCFGAYRNNRQVGFARAITDYATFAYLADVFIDPGEQGKGVGKKLIEFILHYPLLKNLKRWHLVTLDAQGFYEKFGFRNPEHPNQHMEIRRADVYTRTE